MALNMEVGFTPQAMSVPETRETKEIRWADCEDDEGQWEEKREQETGKKHSKRQGKRN